MDVGFQVGCVGEVRDGVAPSRDWGRDLEFVEDGATSGLDLSFATTETGFNSPWLHCTLDAEMRCKPTCLKISDLGCWYSGITSALQAEDRSSILRRSTAKILVGITLLM